MQNFSPYFLLLVAAGTFAAIVWAFVRHVLSIVDTSRMLAAFALYCVTVMLAIFIIDKTLIPDKRLLTPDESALIVESVKVAVYTSFGYFMKSRKNEDS